MTRSELHEAALAYAEAGIPVFPIDRNKRPLCPHGHKQATTNTDIINQWWSDWPEANIGSVPGASGWCVVDLDPPDGPDNWRELGARFGEHPDTWTVRTPRGGLHIYFTGHLPPTTGKLAPHVDTRGDDSYVLLPPSQTADGVYTVECDADIAPVPDWIAPALAAKRKTVVEAPADVPLDQDVNIDRAREYLGRQPALVEGQNSDEKGYILANELRELGLSPETLHGLLCEWQPSFDADWWQEKVTNAFRYGQNGTGAYAGRPAHETFAFAAPNGPAEPTGANVAPAGRPLVAKSSPFHFDDEAEQDNAKDPTWLIKDLIVDESTVVMVGPTGSFKSFLALDIALSVSAHTTSFGHVSARQGPVFYCAREGLPGIKRSRRRAWKEARNVEDVPLFYVGRAPLVADPDQVEDFIGEMVRTAAGRRPGLITLDTVSKCMVGLDENKASDSSRFVDFCDNLRDTFRCPVLAIHHTGKDAERGPRGSSALQAGFDTTLLVEAHPVVKAVRVNVVQHKDAETPEKPWYFGGRLIGGSLVFDPLSRSEYDILTATGDRFANTRVAAMLRMIGALGRDKAVTTNALAIQMTPPVDDESVDATNARIAQTRHRLVLLAKKELEAFCYRTDRDLLWCLPEGV